MTKPDLSRYHRQMLLPAIGDAGQEKLRTARALIVGCGGLGTSIVNMLARAGVGHLVVADRDVVQLTNLQRQILFDQDDAARAIPKAEAARRKIAQINADVAVTAVIDDVNHTNVQKLAAGCDVIVDGLDNLETRFLLNDCAVKLGIPYVYGGAVGTSGMVYTVLPHGPAGAAPRPWEGAGVASPCLRCIFDHAPPPGVSPTCDTVGVLGPIVGAIGNLQAAEAIKVLTAHWGAVAPKIVSIDLWANTVQHLDVASAYDDGQCPCCKGRRFEYLDGKCASVGTHLCGRDAVQLNRPSANQTLPLEQIAQRLSAYGQVSANAFLVQARIRDGQAVYELTLFANGRAIIKGVSDASTAKGVYAKFVGL